MSPFDTVLAIFRNQLVYCLYKFTSSGILQCFSVIFAQVLDSPSFIGPFPLVLYVKLIAYRIDPQGLELMRSLVGPVA